MLKSDFGEFFLTFESNFGRFPLDSELFIIISVECEEFLSGKFEDLEYNERQILNVTRKNEASLRKEYQVRASSQNNGKKLLP